jgi:protein-tyrosine kinase
MTERKPPLDLVSRAAARLNLVEAQTPSATASAAPLHTEPKAAQAPEQPSVAQPDPASARPLKPKPSANQTGAQVELDFVSFQKDGFLTPQSQASRIAEEFRLIKRPLLRIASEARHEEDSINHVIMVTSTHPSDGKSFVTTNLAISMASEQDLFVLVIDADIKRKGLSRRLGVADRPGIMDVLLNREGSISDVMVRTNIPNLGIIPAGKDIAEATELFASQRMTKLVSDVASRYKDRIIIFDTPPVLAASEASVLAAHVGQIAFVVNSGETSKRSIAEALRLIGVCPNVHFVLNRMSQAGADDRFGYYSY